MSAPAGTRAEAAVRSEVVPRLLPWVLTVAGAAGLLAALDLSYERLLLAVDPSYRPTCSVNPLLDCGAVASSDQASLFGTFPNTLIGVASFAVVVTLGVLGLWGVRLPRGVRLGLQVGVVLGAVFVHWLVVVSVFRLGVLCPYCMVVWVATMTLFSYVTLANAADGLLGRRVAASTAVRTLVLAHPLPVLLWVALVAALVGVRFADQWALML
ncbi:vitamin K epoxide reductase family protein [Aquipuribacter nitratireducens]|uniref:Vitamin K epoxide reductase family protein n=1 Tax=Aquipuribacter nitratireducens TaxID=650104 RepID=A0ABW0GRJ8_9MICO